MVPQAFNLNQPTQGGDRKRFDREIKEMASALTHRLTDLHHMNKSHSSQIDQNEDDHGLGVITLAGTNVGATMRSGLDDMDDDIHGMSDDQRSLTTYANSNFQAINNSIMLSGSYNCQDPGVHIETVEYVADEHLGHGIQKQGKKGKRKTRGTSKSDKQSDVSYDETSAT